MKLFSARIPSTHVGATQGVFGVIAAITAAAAAAGTTLRLDEGIFESRAWGLREERKRCTHWTARRRCVDHR